MIIFGSKKIMKLASFDIFDTTLVRKCGSPDNIFYLLSKTYISSKSIFAKFILSMA